MGIARGSGMLFLTGSFERLKRKVRFEPWGWVRVDHRLLIGIQDTG